MLVTPRPHDLQTWDPSPFWCWWSSRWRDVKFEGCSQEGSLSQVGKTTTNVCVQVLCVCVAACTTPLLICAQNLWQPVTVAFLFSTPTFSLFHSLFLSFGFLSFFHETTRKLLQTRLQVVFLTWSFLSRIVINIYTFIFPCNKDAIMYCTCAYVFFPTLRVAVTKEGNWSRWLRSYDLWNLFFLFFCYNSFKSNRMKGLLTVNSNVDRLFSVWAAAASLVMLTLNARFLRKHQVIITEKRVLIKEKFLGEKKHWKPFTRFCSGRTDGTGTYF